MKYIKSFLRILLCLLFVFAFASCGEKKNETEKTEQKTVQQINYTEKWIVEPSIKADNIYSLPLVKFNEETNHYDVSFGDVYVIERDGKFGFINSNGEVVTEPKYDSAETCPCSDGYIVKEKTEGSYSVTYLVNSSLKSIWRYPHKCTQKGDYVYKWNQTASSLSIEKLSGETSVKTGKKAVLPETAKLKDNETKFVFVGANGLITQDTYDGAGIYTGSLAAVSKGGKWGYVNSSGKTVIPFEFSAVEGYRAVGSADTPYECSENYVTVLKDGKYGIYKSDGTAVVPCKYKFLTTVHDGRAFCSDGAGIWGILCIDESISDGIISPEEKTSVSTKTSFSSSASQSSKNSTESSAEE